MALAGGRQGRGLGPERRDGRTCIGIEPGLARQVAGQLRDAGRQGFDGLAGAGFLGAEGVAFDGGAVQKRGGHGLFLAQWRHGGFCIFAGFGGGAGIGFGTGGGGQRLAQRGLCHAARFVGLFPAAIEQQPFGLTQFGADLAIPCGLSGLPGELCQLAGQLIQHIVDSRQIGFGPLQLELSLMAALIEARNASGFLKNAPPGLGFGVDQLRDLPLPHQRRRMRPGGSIGKQHLHIARPHIAAIGLEGRSGIAGDAADHIERVGFVETGRGQPFGIVDAQRDLGKIARRTRRGPGEDHVLHPRPAHRSGTVFAHHPSERLKQVRFATAIGPDHPGQTIGDDQVGRIDEAFEAIQPET